MEKSTILVELQDHMGNDQSIAYSAWVSTYNKDSRDHNSNDLNRVNSLVERLIKEGHGVPLESVVFRFWCRIPIYIDRQIEKHRVSSQNGASLRYRTAPDDFYPIPQDVIEILNNTSTKVEPQFGPTWLSEVFTIEYNKACENANENYRKQLESLKQAEKQGVISNNEYKRCREILRGQLPLANMTEKTITINLRSFANFVKLRLSEHAQPEIQEVARLMLQEVEKVNICPIAIKTLKEIQWKV